MDGEAQFRLQTELDAYVEALVRRERAEADSAAARADVAATLGALDQAVDGRPPPGSLGVSILFDPATVSAAALGLAVAKAGGAFLEGYGKTLGEWFAERTTKLRRDYQEAERAAQEAIAAAGILKPLDAAVTPPSSVRLELPPGGRMPDEAVLALAELDFTDPTLADKTLRWDTQKKAWHPTVEPETPKGTP